MFPKLAEFGQDPGFILNLVTQNCIFNSSSGKATAGTELLGGGQALLAVAVSSNKGISIVRCLLETYQGSWLWYCGSYLFFLHRKKNEFSL